MNLSIFLLQWYFIVVQECSDRGRFRGDLIYTKRKEKRKRLLHDGSIWIDISSDIYSGNAGIGSDYFSNSIKEKTNLLCQGKQKNQIGFGCFFFYV